MKIIVDIPKQDYNYITKKHCLPSCDERTLRNNYYEMILKSVPLELSEAEQPKTGHWTRVKSKGHLVWECTCGWQQRFYTNYCPDCGAKMIESE